MRVVCGDMYCRPYSYCRRRQFMPVLSAHIVALRHILSLATIYADIDTFFHANGTTIYALSLTQVVAGDRICRQL